MVLLKDAISQYGVDAELAHPSRSLKTLKMDDIDFLEALQLIENGLLIRIDKRTLGPSTTIEDVVTLIDDARARAR
jgi:hypothetical protein